MRILLDAHLLLWWLKDSPSLFAEARKMISDPENSGFVPINQRYVNSMPAIKSTIAAYFSHPSSSHWKSSGAVPELPGTKG